MVPVYIRLSPDNGCRVATLEHTSVSKEAVMCLIYLIVADSGESTHVADHCMINGECFNYKTGVYWGGSTHSVDIGHP